MGILLAYLPSWWISIVKTGEIKLKEKALQHKIDWENLTMNKKIKDGVDDGIRSVLAIIGLIQLIH